MSGAVLAFYLLSHPTSPVSGLIGGEAYYGLLERIVVVLEIVLVIALANAGKVAPRAFAPERRPEHALNG